MRVAICQPSVAGGLHEFRTLEERFSSRVLSLVACAECYLIGME